MQRLYKGYRFCKLSYLNCIDLKPTWALVYICFNLSAVRPTPATDHPGILKYAEQLFAAVPNEGHDRNL